MAEVDRSSSDKVVASVARVDSWADELLTLKATLVKLLKSYDDCLSDGPLLKTSSLRSEVDTITRRLDEIERKLDAEVRLKL